MLRRFLVILALVCSAGSVHAADPGDTLCPRGAYSIKRDGGETTLMAVVRLPTPGYRVELKQEREHPMVARLVCARPSGMVAQVITTYSASLPIEGARQVFVQDARGRKLVKLAAVAQPPKCRSNADCRGRNEFCDTTPRCGPNAPGRCVRKPEICTMQFDPVEGCDGKTYPNACKAVSEGVSVRARPN